MTPTLRGRWQTRLVLLLTVGVGITALFGVLYQDFGAAFSTLGYILALGLVWDVVYNYFQTWRWDHDWSPALYLATGIWEAVILWVLIRYSGLPGIPNANPILFIFHYGTLWVATMLLMFGPLRVIFPRWRFRGGQWL
jgi:hypothetical protein